VFGGLGFRFAFLQHTDPTKVCVIFLPIFIFIYLESAGSEGLHYLEGVTKDKERLHMPWMNWWLMSYAVH